MKTAFEELFSLIMFTDKYDGSLITFWYLGDHKLQPLFVVDIIEKVNKGFNINSYKDGEYELIWIPIQNIYVVTYNNTYLLDRRAGYQGKHNMDLPENVIS